MQSNAAKVLRQLGKYRDGLSTKSASIRDELAQIGSNTAIDAFAETTNADPDPLSVYTWATDEECKVIAKGRSVVFREFGEGNHLKREQQEEYPWHIAPFERPDWLVGHGEWGNGNGEFPGWWLYYGGTGDNPPPDTEGAKSTYYVISPKPRKYHTGDIITYHSEQWTKTRGNRPAKAMLNADLEMRANVVKVAKDVFKR